jgi:hypothetical protein
MCDDASEMQRSQKRGADGVLSGGPAAALGTGMYRGLQKLICPTESVQRIYRDNWLKNGVLSYGVRLLELMKHGPWDFYCYDKGHQHIIPKPAATARYTNVIGRGAWYIKRMQTILMDVQDAGYEKDSSFALTSEFSPPEALIPYFNEVYSSDSAFQFVYSNLVSTKMSLITDFATHPGYRERYLREEKGVVRPDYMLSEDRDTAQKPITPEDISQSFAEWRDAAMSYFTQHFTSEPGIAPNYPNYTYNRCVQDVFNLRARIFEIGTRAVMGERIILPAVFLEEPFDYNEELVNMAARAVQLQKRYYRFFRNGYILGETKVVVLDAEEKAWAWGSHRLAPRPFDDVPELVANVTGEDKQLGPARFPLFDFISRPVDQEAYDLQGGGVFRNEIITPLRIPHLIWQHGEGDDRRVLYLFANIGNTPTSVEFIYGRGLEGISPDAGWKRITTTITPDGTTQETAEVWLGYREMSLLIRERSFVGILLRRAKVVDDE